VESRPEDFATTRWTRVLAARGDSPEAETALSELCAAYYNPVLAFIRRNATSEDSARELTQEFFARLLAKHGIDSVDPQRGRFRSYLLGAVKHFLADMRDQASSAKRGGGQSPLTLETEHDFPAATQSPDREFDRKWALTLLNRAMEKLAAERRDGGKTEEFDTLKPWLIGDTDTISQADAARMLGTNENAVKVAIHRLRRRFRELIRCEIRQTVSHHDDVADEMRYLLESLL